MRLKGTNRRLKKKGGFDFNEMKEKFFKKTLLEILKAQKNFYLEQFIERTKIDRYMNIANIATRILPKSVFNKLATTYVNQNALAKSINAGEYLTKDNAVKTIKGIKDVLTFLKSDELLKSDFFDQLYDKYKDNFKKLFSKYIRNSGKIDEHDLTTILFDEQIFYSTYDFIISKLQTLKETSKEYKISNDILKILTKDPEIKKDFFNGFKQMFKTDEINGLFQKIKPTMDDINSDKIKEKDSIIKDFIAATENIDEIKHKLQGKNRQQLTEILKTSYDKILSEDGGTQKLDKFKEK
jgi:hypothetical protein